MDFTKLMPTAPRDDQATQGAMGALMGVALGAIMTDLFLEKGKETAKPQQETQPVNPYRGSQTVGELEKTLLLQPTSHRREHALKELAKYPETMPLAQLPTQTMHLLSGR